MKAPKQNRANATILLPRYSCRGEVQTEPTEVEREWALIIGSSRKPRCMRRTWAPSVHCWQHGGAKVEETYLPVLLGLAPPEWELTWQLTREGMSVDQAVDCARALAA